MLDAFLIVGDTFSTKTPLLYPGNIMDSPIFLRHPYVITDHYSRVTMIAESQELINQAIANTDIKHTMVSWMGIILSVTRLSMICRIKSVATRLESKPFRKYTQNRLG